jgi:pilus assembly protein CpaB
MKPKTMILMVVAVTCGLGASYMTSQLLADRQQEQPEQQAVPKVTVLVAKRPLSPGTLFKTPEEDFQPKQFDKGQEPANALTDVGQLKGERLKRSLRVGDYVSKDDLVDKNGSSLADDLPKGMRAIGLPVNQLVSASGFASLPGSHVDILWTARGNSGDSNFTKVLLENVKILAADTTDRVDDKKWVVASVVTVALSVEDALLASIAMDTGKVSFLLRNSIDDQPVDVEKVTLNDVVKPRKKLESEEGEGADGAGRTGKGGGKGSIEGIPDLPSDGPKRADASPVPPIEVPLTHKLTIHNGPTPTTAKFELDKKTKAVVSTDITAPEPAHRPTVQQPPAGSTPPTPPAPAPAPSAAPPNGRGAQPGSGTGQ